MNKVEIGYRPGQATLYFKQTPGRVRKGLDQLLKRLRVEGARVAKDEAPKAETTLTNSILEARQSQSHHQIIANQHYAKYMEEGTDPGGTPSQQALEDWVSAKGITPYDIHTEPEQMLFLIARSIRQKGVTAQPFMTPAHDHIKRRLPSLVQRVLNDSLSPT